MAKNSKMDEIPFGSRTDVGRLRDHNEDSLAVESPLFVVCDGMGGHAAGEVASEIAVDVVCQRAPRTTDAEALGQAVEEANLAVIKAAREGVGRAGMGCTCTAAILEKERLVIAQVGDSRAYLLHQGTMQQLTRDHSLVADLVEAGQITEAEARVHPQRSVITRALGSDPRTEPDLFEINVEAGDRLLLCSDGLSTMLEDFEIERILAQYDDPQACANALVDAANEKGGYDNITVIVVDVTGMAAQHHRKMTRRARATAIMLSLLLVAIIAGCIYGFNYVASNSAYLVDEDGYVAIYQGVPGDVFGISANHLARVTDIPTDELQPGTANRLRGEGIKVDSMEAAERLVGEYEIEVADKRGETASTTPDAGGDAASADAAGADAADNAASAENGADSPAATPEADNASTPQAAG